MPNWFSRSLNLLIYNEYWLVSCFSFQMFSENCIKFSYMLIWLSQTGFTATSEGVNKSLCSWSWIFILLLCLPSNFAGERCDEEERRSSNLQGRRSYYGSTSRADKQRMRVPPCYWWGVSSARNIHWWWFTSDIESQRGRNLQAYSWRNV